MLEQLGLMGFVVGASIALSLLGLLGGKLIGFGFALIMFFAWGAQSQEPTVVGLFALVTVGMAVLTGFQVYSVVFNTGARQ